jgi:hypothetical protein
MMNCTWGKGKGRAIGSQFQGDIIDGGSGTVFDRQGQVEPLAAQVEIGIAPAMQVGGAAQGLAGAILARTFPDVVNEHDGEVELPLKFA